MTVKNTTAAAKTPVIAPEKVQDQVNDLYVASVQWLQSHWLQILVGIGVATGIALLLFWLRGFGPKLAMRSKSGKGWPAVFGRAIQRTGTFFIIMLSARLVTRFAGAPDQVASTINFLFTIATVFQAAIWAREIILGAIEHRARSEHYAGEALVSAMGLIRLLVTFVLFAIALIVVLDNLGVNVTGLVAGLGVGGIAIGLAAQGIFADLFAALAIIFDRPFRRGDAVSYDQTSGTVEEIGLKSTRIRGVNGEERIISNKQLLDKEITNNTRREFRRTKFVIGVAYETPAETLERIPGLFKEIIDGMDGIFVRSGFAVFNASSLDFELEFDSPHPDFQHAYDLRHKVGLAIVKRFAEEGISIPYPTQTTFTAAPDGHLIMPYADVQAVKRVDLREDEA